MNTDEYENMTWETPSDELEDAVENLLAEVKRIQQDTLKVASEWFDWVGGDENEWRRLEQALGLPLTPLSWEGEDE